MGWTHKMLDRFSLFDLIIIAMMAALGIAIKPVVVPLAHIVSGPLFIPSGAVAGGFYMMWLVLGFGLTGKRGTATLIALVQALVVTGTGMVGSHGAMSLFTYTVPGVMADLGLLLIGHRVCCSPCAFLAGMLANMGGTIMVNLVYFRLPLIPLVLALSVAALSGGLGGILAFQIRQQLLRFQTGALPGSPES
ncbi:MAG: ECF transporter S component [Syntrophomonas sp.]|uniref:ECF transporter S component n=1 Tax=Syntrophomonas sp. TaxID=2053627 RepID=UPI002632961F|nr:ECF transporter S component [Syntrophomonas sp.]MDD2511219.1 ECF transporter S component [Syntrophomonas sp.]MDD4626626.1 ECF transporter S component [Syntrophomonas sp.]